MKSMKKLVLAGLVLLASVVVFVGCKNDSVPESTPVTETVQEIPYLTFSATAEQTMTISTSGTYTLHESLEYSVNKGDWKQLVAGTPITFGGENGDLRMRGKSAGGTSTDIENFSTVSFGNSDVMVSCTGDIRTLVDWEAHTTASTSQARFPFLFYECSSLISAPALPATTLAEGCYYGMFAWTSLTTAPVLPATTLAEGCYYGMFACTSLTTAPALPATTLAEGCYNDMFGGCTSLATAPALPATTLADYCYSAMFSGCTSLTTAPALPATTLADHCYSGMFDGCTSLTTVPALPATTLADYCYFGMFDGCTSLTTAPALPATTLADKCYSGMFDGCTSLTTAPALPATTLADHCYSGMFDGCTSLTTAPALLATTLADYCYSSMFSGCTSLNSVTMLATDISATGCLAYWLRDVAATGTFTKAEGLAQGDGEGQIPDGSYGIPSGWTVKNHGE